MLALVQYPVNLLLDFLANKEPALVRPLALILYRYGLCLHPVVYDTKASLQRFVKLAESKNAGNSLEMY